MSVAGTESSVQQTLRLLPSTCRAKIHRVMISYHGKIQGYDILIPSWDGTKALGKWIGDFRNIFIAVRFMCVTPTKFQAYIGTKALGNNWIEDFRNISSLL